MKKSTKKALVISSLAVAIQGLLFASVSTVAQANNNKKPIGDLEVYRAAEGGKVTLTMMLDTSGSMYANDSNLAACDWGIVLEGGGKLDSQIKTVKSTTTPQYNRTLCELPTHKKYYTYRYAPTADKHSECEPDGTCSSGDWKNGKPPNYNNSRKDLNVEIHIQDRRQPDGWARYYNGEKIYTLVPLSESEKRPIAGLTEAKPDRITRLRDALFALMDSPALSSTKVAIGIGHFPASTDENGAAIAVQGSIGKMVIPAALLNEEQRLKIKEVVATLGAGGGTPAAQAYAEVGAYMLGTSTKNPGTFSVIEKRPDPVTGIAVDTRVTYDIPTGFDRSDVSAKRGDNYISPLTNVQSCDGQGIYFLTDGEPNNSFATDELMKKALGNTHGAAFNVPEAGKGTLPDSTNVNGNMPEAGAFAKALREADKNPSNLSIRTAVVGFGSVFDTSKYNKPSEGVFIQRQLRKPELDKKTSMPIQGKYKEDDEQGTYFDCNLIPNTAIDAKNACNWGAKSHPDLPGVGGYGEGGFFSAQSTDDVISSVKEFLGDLQNDISASPSGTISIADDPYSVSGQQAIAYLPVIQPKVATREMVWPGNMKKYYLRNGTIWGKNAERLYRNIKGDINPAAQDGWSNESEDNNKVDVGGFFAQLKTPKGNVESVRQVYIEDFTGTGTTAAARKPKLRKFGVNAQGKITLDGSVLSANNRFHDVATYNFSTVIQLLHFLGFTEAWAGTSRVWELDKLPANTQLNVITLRPPVDEIRVLGGSPHSTPTTVSYSAKLTSRGSVSTDPADREDYVLFGSMDGALHLVNARDSSSDASENSERGGQEIFAFIPKVMLQKQAKALKRGALHDKASTDFAAGHPVFGIDAPWAVVADYTFNNDTAPTQIQINTKPAQDKKPAGRGVYAYGGFRLGGEGLYGLKLNNRNAPELAFALTPQQTGFERLGQIWAKPVSAKIKQGSASKDVIIFGGGYDLCYENEDFQVGITNDKFAIKNDQRGTACSGKTEAIGNTVYMVDAYTGARLWTATHTNMKHSIVGGVTPLDRDNDGNIDAIYFADLGGQVFRADFDNSATSSSVSSKRVVRLLQPAGAGKMVRRFYEKPVVSIYRADQTFKGADAHKMNHDLFALVNVISGDRSNPTSKMRTNLSDADRLYGIFDTDIGAADFYTNTSLSAREINDSQLENLSDVRATADEAGVAAKRARINTVKTKKGWYQPIVDFDGYTDVKYGKGVGKSEVIGSILFSSVYNPDKAYSTSISCEASVKGGTERQMYCLPYGICLNERSTNGKGGFSPAGQGISELTLGPLDGTSAGSRKRVLISNVEINADSVSGSNRVDYNEGVTDSSIVSNQGGEGGAKKDGGMGSHPAIIVDPRFTLQPLRWYDNTTKN